MQKETLTIKRLGINGEGIGYIHKKICFIPKALPGEEADVEIDVNERRYMTGHITHLRKISPARVESPCRQSKNCQGCAFMHMNYSDQLLFKRDLIEETLKKYTNLSLRQVKILPVIEANQPLHYRSSIAFAISEFSKELRIGLYQRGTKFFSLMDECLLQDKEINRVLVNIEYLLNKHHMKAYNDKTKKGLRFLIVKCVEEKLQVVFVTGEDGLSKKVSQELSLDKQISGIFYTVNTARYQDFNMAGYKKIYGDSYLKYHINNHVYALSIKSDLWMHKEMEEKKLEILKNLINEDDVVLSLYAGNGIIESELPSFVTALEEEKWHVEDASRNVKDNKIIGKVFIKADINEEVSRQTKKHKFDCMLIHLRKDLLDEDILDSIIKSKMKVVIFTSENISALSKGISQLENNYKVIYFQSFDEPYTARFQTIVKMVKK